ncbi:MAG: GNAT family N-acetyltransferase [Muribaculaceae bacterium]|nr:GNAT family N-acetyltransferase [Muribaculaceae bacterium]
MNIHDNILMLRALEPTDLDVLYRWENDEELWHTSATITPFSRKQLWDYIENYDGDIFRTHQLRLMIVEVATYKVVGTLDLFDFDPINSRASVGILIDKEFQGQGYGKMALNLIEDYCKKHISLNQLVATVSVDNERSLALFCSLEYSEVGVMKWWLKRGNQYCDAILFQKRI